MAFNAIAWLCATSEDPEVRDPQKALVAAQRAVELGGDAVPDHHLDTLAEAQFVKGHFDEAIEIEERAISMRPDYDALFVPTGSIVTGKIAVF